MCFKWTINYCLSFIEKKQVIPYSLLLLLLSISACTDVIVPDIQEEQIALLSPPDSLSTNVQTQTLQWEEIRFAEGYRLELVEPSFDSLQRFVVDSNLTILRYEVTLPEGQYQWRVTGYNEAYETLSSEIRMLTITSEDADDLTMQSITLITPTAEFCTNESNLTFAWNTLTGADSYTLQFGDEGFVNIAATYELSEPTFNSTFDDTEGIHYWRVRAENETSLSHTQWVTRRFEIDQTPPNAPTLAAPVNEAILFLADQSPDLSWTAATDAVLDTLFIYADLTKDTLLLQVATEEIDYDLNEQGFPAEDYFWQVQSIDKVNNSSTLSELRVFYVEE